MSERWMGFIGLAFAAVGAVGFWLGQKRIESVLRGLPETLAHAADERLGRLNLAAIAIAAAVAIYLIARQLGRGRIGLYACVTLLVLNAILVAILRVRWLAALGPDLDTARRHRRASWLQALGAIVGFGGIAVYLLR